MELDSDLVLQAYMKKKDNEALNYFSESICLAPAESSVLPLAYANRSAVLYQMHRYKVMYLIVYFHPSLLKYPKGNTVLPPILHEISQHCRPQNLNLQNFNH